MRFFAAAAAGVGFGVLTFLASVAMEGGVDGLTLVVTNVLGGHPTDEGQRSGLILDMGISILGFLVAFPVAGYTFYRVASSPRWKR